MAGRLQPVLSKYLTALDTALGHGGGQYSVVVTNETELGPDCVSARNRERFQLVMCGVLRVCMCVCVRARVRVLSLIHI